jgi:hypothetical protein
MQDPSSSDGYVIFSAPVAEEPPTDRAVVILKQMEASMGRGILLWLLGIPIPIIILLALFWR